MDGTFASNAGLTRDDFDPGARGRAILPEGVPVSQWTPNEVALYEEQEEQARLRQQPRQQHGAVVGVASDRSDELRRAESWEKRRMVQNAQEISDLTSDLAGLVHRADEQFDTLDTNLADAVEFGMRGVEEVGTGAKGTVMGSEALGYGTTMATAGATGTAIGGAAGAITGLLAPIPGGAAAGGAVGAGLGVIVSTALTKAQEDAVRATIDRQLQAARDVVRGDTGGEGPLADADKVKWKYAGLTGLVWSREMTPMQLVADLDRLPASKRRQSVQIKWNRVQRASCASFANSGAATAWIRQALRTGTAGVPPATTAHPPAQQDTTVAQGTRRVSAEHEQDEHLLELERHANTIGLNLAAINAAVQSQGEKANRAQHQALQSNAIMAAAANAHAAGTQRWFKGRFGFGLEDTGLEVAHADAAAARAKPRWVRREEMSACMICRDPFDCGTFVVGKVQLVISDAKAMHHCRYCGWAVCDDCSKQKVKGLERWLSKADDRAVCHHPPSTEALRVCDACLDASDGCWDVVVSWMWGDAGTSLTRGLAVKNRLRWSTASLSEVIAQLGATITDGRVRPVLVEWKGATQRFSSQQHAVEWMTGLMQAPARDVVGAELEPEPELGVPPAGGRRAPPSGGTCTPEERAAAQVASNLAAVRDVHGELDRQLQVMTAAGNDIGRAQGRVDGMQETLQEDGADDHCIIA